MNTPPTPKRRLPSSPSLSPRFFQPIPSKAAQPNIISSLHARTPSRGNASTPRPQSPQESYFNMSSFGYPSPKSMSPTSPTTRPIGSFSPRLRHLSPAPSSGVSSVKSMSENDSSDEEIFSPLTQNQKVYLPDPESESESEDAPSKDVDIDLEAYSIPVDLSEDMSVLSDPMLASSGIASHKSSITIEELPALPISPSLSRTTSSGSSVSNASGHVSWQEVGLEVIQGEYSSCASSSELDTTDDPQTEDDEIDDFEWNVDVCSSSYPTDDFLLGGILGLSTDGGMGAGINRAYTYNVAHRPATPFSPRKRGYSVSSFVENTEKKNTLKRRSLNTPTTKKRRRIYSLFDDDSEGDDESDECESPAKRVKGRMTIDTVLNGNMKQQNNAGARRGSISQMFGINTTEDMDVDL